MGKSTISMAMFNSYVKLPEGKSHFTKINQVTSKKFPIDSGLFLFFFPSMYEKLIAIDQLFSMEYWSLKMMIFHS